MGVSICSDFAHQLEDHSKLGVIRLDHLYPSSTICTFTLRGKFLGRAVHKFTDTLSEGLFTIQSLGKLALP